MATEQQLREQYELDKKKLGLSQQQIEENLRLGKDKLGLTQQQLEQSYRLSQQQLEQLELEKKGQSSKLAQQAYISKQQTERVLTNILSSQGLSNTGYANVRKNQLESSYQGQQGAIQSDLQSSLSGYNRQREAQSLGYQQNLQDINFNRQQMELEYQQNLKALELQRESASLDFRYALQSLQEQLARSRSSSGSGSGGYNTAQSNAQLINQYESLDIEQNKLNPNNIGKQTQAYVDEGYITQAEKAKLDKNLTDYYMTVNTGITPSFNVPTTIPKSTPTVKPKQAQATTTQKLQKALAIGQW